MKIRTQFVINIIVLGVVLLLVSAVMIITNRWIADTHQRVKLAGQIEREAYELGYLANDYLLYQESQQAERWGSKFASFSDHLSNLSASTPEQQALLVNIQANRQGLEAVFTDVRADIENAAQTQAGFDERLLKVSWNRLEVQTQGMIFNAARLERVLSEQQSALTRLTGLL